MKLTKSEAIEKHRKMWRWIAEQIEKEENKDKPCMELKREYIENQKLDWIISYCFLCEYKYQEKNRDCCILKWPGNRNSCCFGMKNDETLGLYILCDIMIGLGKTKKAAAIARRISNLPEMEDTQ